MGEQVLVLLLEPPCSDEMNHYYARRFHQMLVDG